MAYHQQSSLLGQLKVSDPKDIHKDMCLYTYVVELPGVKEEDVKIRVSEGRFLIIEAHGCKVAGNKYAETVSPGMERLRKRAWEMMEEDQRMQREMMEKNQRMHRDEMEQNQRMHREEMEENQRMHREEMEEIEMRIQEQERIKHLMEMEEKENKKFHEEQIKHLKEMGKMRKKLREELEELQRMSQQEASYHVALAFQRACGSNNTYHKSPASVHAAGMNYTLPQFNFSVPLSSFPPAAPIPFGHRGFAGSANLHENFSVNPSTTPASSTTGYDDVMNSGAWIYGSTGPRTESAIPASTYYSFRRQGQHHSHFQQGQQHSHFQQGQQQQQHYGNLGYPNFYPYHVGVSQEHLQQQTQNDGSPGPTI